MPRPSSSTVRTTSSSTSRVTGRGCSPGRAGRRWTAPPAAPPAGAAGPRRRPRCAAAPAVCTVGRNPSDGSMPVMVASMSSRRSAARCGLASSKIVRRMSLMVSSSWSTAALIRSATRPVAGEPGGVLQRQTDREQPLDHQVVQVPADPVAVLEHRQPGPVVLGQRDLQHQRHLLGEALARTPRSVACTRSSRSGSQRSQSTPAIRSVAPTRTSRSPAGSGETDTPWCSTASGSGEPVDGRVDRQRRRCRPPAARAVRRSAAAARAPSASPAARACSAITSAGRPVDGRAQQRGADRRPPPPASGGAGSAGRRAGRSR